MKPDDDKMKKSAAAAAATAAADDSPKDAPPKDAPPTDAGTTDAGPKEAGPKEAGPKEAGPKDDAVADTAPQPSTLMNRLARLPVEILNLIYTNLANRDIKNLRLQSTLFRDTAKLRFNRVFLSANQRDIDVFLAVADHDTLRKGITTIIWDDGVVPGVKERYEDRRGAEVMYVDLKEAELDNHWFQQANGYPEWFANACENGNDELKGRYYFDLRDPHDNVIATQIPLEESWAYYQQLASAQREVIASGSDEAALRYGLRRFTSLQSIAITPATHGMFPCFPLYDTPTIRARPQGVNYPPPLGWPSRKEYDDVHPMLPWTDNEGGVERHRNRFRGFRIVTRALSEQQPTDQEDGCRVVELVLDSHELESGVNCRIFEVAENNPDYDNLVTLLRQPGFRRLDLSLAVGCQEEIGWPAFRSTYLKRALQGLGEDFRHISLTTDQRGLDDWRHYEASSDPPIEHHIPLRTIFPLGCWPKLEHFGLSGFFVTQEDLMAFLQALPGTVRSLFLGDLFFIHERTGESWRSLLNEMRNGLGWRTRPSSERPRVSIRLREVDGQIRRGRSTWVKESFMDDFLYGEGANPFGPVGEGSGMRLEKGHGMVVRDAFDTDYVLPYIGLVKLMKLGYVQEDPMIVNSGLE